MYKAVYKPTSEVMAVKVGVIQLCYFMRPKIKDQKTVNPILIICFQVCRKKRNAKEIQTFCQESELLRSLENPHIVKYKHVSYTFRSLTLVSPLKDLPKLIKAVLGHGVSPRRKAVRVGQREKSVWLKVHGSGSIQTDERHLERGCVHPREGNHAPRLEAREHIVGEQGGFEHGESH